MFLRGNQQKEIARNVSLMTVRLSLCVRSGNKIIAMMTFKGRKFQVPNNLRQSIITNFLKSQKFVLQHFTQNELADIADLSGQKKLKSGNQLNFPMNYPCGVYIFFNLSVQPCTKFAAKIITLILENILHMNFRLILDVQCCILRHCYKFSSCRLKHYN
jgi:hypothetical protein